MDANTLAKYIGKEHVEEVQTLMENDSQLQNKVSFKNPIHAKQLTPSTPGPAPAATLPIPPDLRRFLQKQV